MIFCPPGFFKTFHFCKWLPLHRDVSTQKQIESVAQILHASQWPAFKIGFLVSSWVCTVPDYCNFFLHAPKQKWANRLKFWICFADFRSVTFYLTSNAGSFFFVSGRLCTNWQVFWPSDWVSTISNNKMRTFFGGGCIQCECSRLKSRVGVFFFFFWSRGEQTQRSGS